MPLKKIFIAAALLCAALPAYAGNPIIGAAGFDADTQKGSLFLKMLERSINAAAYMSGSFDIINSNLMYDQLNRFGCTGEICATGFARDAGISVFIMSSSREEGDNLLLNIRAFGTDIPYGGKVFYEKTYTVSRWTAMAPQNSAYIAEEISYRFFADMLENFEQALPCTVIQSAMQCAEPLNGEFAVVEKYGNENGYSLFRAVGRVRFNGGAAQTGQFDDSKKYYALKGYLRKSKEIRDYISGRKSEMVFFTPSYIESAYIAMLTPVLAATMPLTAPLGYYARSDYAGFALWAANYAPWAYLTWKGYSYGVPVPDKVKRKETFSSKDRVNQWFFWYMACSGNVPLFADAAAGYGLANARVFKGKEPYLGNNATAVLLSVAGGGGGMFFKGERRWGYFYFHANNILIYSSLYYLLGDTRINTDGSYTEVRRDRTTGYALCGAFLFLKAVEITHTMLTDERIYSGEANASRCQVSPLVSAGSSGIFYGAAADYAF